jgi:hypothetical protein
MPAFDTVFKGKRQQRLKYVPKTKPKLSLNAESNKPQSLEPNPLKMDPTRLQGVRRPVVVSVRSKYKLLADQLYQKIIDERFLQGVPESPLIADGAVNLDTQPSDESAYNVSRVDELELWLSGRVSQLIDEDFVSDYIERAYIHGRKRAYTDSHKSKLKPQPNVMITNAADFEEGGKESFVRSGETSLVSKKAKQSLVSQAFSSLKGIAGQMIQSVKQIILTGIRKFWTPKQIAKAVQDEVNRYEKKTEVSVKDDLVRAHGESQLDAFAELGHNEVMAIIETAGDNKVCAKCRVLEGREVPLEQARGLLPAHPNCTKPKSTQVFTRDGWKWMEALTTDDYCLSENPETGLCEFVKVKDVIVQTYDGEYVELHHKWLYQEFTADHNCYVITRPSAKYRKKLKYQIVPHNEKNIEYFIPIKARRFKSQSPVVKQIGNMLVSFDTYVKLMGYFLADGSCTLRKEGNYQIKISTQKKCEQQNILDDLSEFRQYLNLRCDSEGVHIQNGQLGNFLFQFGKTHDKYIPQDILESDRAALFLAVFNKTDGNVRSAEWSQKGIKSKSFTYFTISPKLRDGLSLLLLKAGRGFSIRVQKPKIAIKKNNEVIKSQYPLYILFEKHSNFIHSHKIQEHREYYHGVVHCVELEQNHTLFVNQRGQCSWIGNCRCAWRPVPPRLLLSPKEKDKRKNETIQETIVRLESELTKLRDAEEKTVKRSSRRQDDVESRDAIGEAMLNRLKMESQIRERRAAQMRIDIACARHDANAFILTQAELQKELESKRIDNDGYSDTKFAKYVIERERLVEIAKDALLDLPDIDTFLKEADAAYNKEKNKQTKSGEKAQGDTSNRTLVEIRALTAYLEKLSVFAQQSKLSLLAYKVIRLIPQIISEAEQLEYLAEHPTPPDIHVAQSHRTLNDSMSKPYWKTAPESVKESVRIYSNIGFYSGINGVGRAYNDGEILKELHNVVKSKTLTEKQKKEISQFSRTVNGKTIDGEKMIEYLAGMQQAAKLYKTTEPLLLRRRVAHFEHYRQYKNGDVFPLPGITSTFGTESAFNNSKFEYFGTFIMEIRCPVGVHVIPIGNNGTSWQSLDEIALPHGTQVKLLERYITTTPPKMIVEIVPSDVVEL